MKPIPEYAVDLLMAAKWVVNPPVGTTPAMREDDMAELLDAVIAFERQMPIVDGVIVTESAS